jgi:hypothetical protein
VPSSLRLSRPTYEHGSLNLGGLAVVRCGWCRSTRPCSVHCPAGCPLFQACASGDQATLNRFLVPKSLSLRAQRRGELRVDPRPQGPAGRRDTRHHGDGQLGAVWPGQPGCPRARCDLRHVSNRSAGRKMVCSGDPCIYAADGDPMTWFTSPLVVPCSGIPATEGARKPAPGLRHPGQLTDVHGREG